MKTPMKLTVSICIPAYNEGSNILQILESLRVQRTKRIRINRIIIVSSGSTDDTDQIVRQYCARHPQFTLIVQPVRGGKASAINAFLREVDDDIIVIESADTIPLPDTIEQLCAPFVRDPKIGMTGGAPIPVNDPDTFLGYIIHTWWWFHRHIPRFGEIIAYRNVLEDISQTTAVDEAFIQAKMIQRGYKVVHVDTAVVRNKGPETISDLIKQRRRIFNGHARLYEEESVKIDNMTMSSLRLILTKFEIASFKHLMWFAGGMALEVYARGLGAYDQYVRKINPYIWDTASSTKNLKKNLKEQISRRIVFLNFAPIQFMGGAERWMHDVSEVTSMRVKTTLMDVHPSLADIYGRLILNQKYEKRKATSDKVKNRNHSSLTLASFIPFTNSWRKARRELKSAQTIYIRYEVLELLILLYLGGAGSLKKTIAGIHSPYHYENPQRVMDHIHNIVYSSRLSQLFLRSMNKVHVLNRQHVDFFANKFNLKNVVLIPNYSQLGAKNLSLLKNHKSVLNIAYVGELTKRKGIDTLVETIKNATPDMKFYIAGDGPMRDEINTVAKKNNVEYLGYLNEKELTDLYTSSDVFFMPSRAESLSLASLDAISHGLPIVASPYADMGLPSYIQLLSQDNSPRSYQKIFKTKLSEKKNNTLGQQKKQIFKYAKEQFSKDMIMSQLNKQLFDI